jgi:hypothetical protein
MIWFLSLLILLLLLLCYLLFAPFYLEINSKTGLFRVRFHKLVSARIFITDNSLFMDLKIVWWHKIFDLLASKEKPMKTEKNKIKKEKPKISLRKILLVVKTFKVNKFYLTIDTGSMWLNGMIYPLFLWLGMRLKRNVTVNFVNENEIIFETENNLFRILRVYITS